MSTGINKLQMELSKQRFLLHRYQEKNVAGRLPKRSDLIKT